MIMRTCLSVAAEVVALRQELGTARAQLAAAETARARAEAAAAQASATHDPVPGLQVRLMHPPSRGRCAAAAAVTKAAWCDPDQCKLNPKAIRRSTLWRLPSGTG